MKLLKSKDPKGDLMELQTSLNAKMKVIRNAHRRLSVGETAV
jgi:hypothetical protein